MEKFTYTHIHTHMTTNFCENNRNKINLNTEKLHLKYLPHVRNSIHCKSNILNVLWHVKSSLDLNFVTGLLTCLSK